VRFLGRGGLLLGRPAGLLGRAGGGVLGHCVFNSLDSMQTSPRAVSHTTTMQTSLRRRNVCAHVYRCPASVPSGVRIRSVLVPGRAVCAICRWGVTPSDEPARRASPAPSLPS
jgi:hypothetical protein